MRFKYWKEKTKLWLFIDGIFYKKKRKNLKDSTRKSWKFIGSFSNVVRHNLKIYIQKTDTVSYIRANHLYDIIKNSIINIKAVYKIAVSMNVNVV